MIWSEIVVNWKGNISTLIKGGGMLMRKEKQTRNSESKHFEVCSANIILSSIVVARQKTMNWWNSYSFFSTNSTDFSWCHWLLCSECSFIITMMMHQGSTEEISYIHALSSVFWVGVESFHFNWVFVICLFSYGISLHSERLFFYKKAFPALEIPFAFQGSFF